jgi:hypothetical protein
MSVGRWLGAVWNRQEAARHLADSAAVIASTLTAIGPARLTQDPWERLLTTVVSLQKHTRAPALSACALMARCGLLLAPWVD